MKNHSCAGLSCAWLRSLRMVAIFFSFSNSSCSVESRTFRMSMRFFSCFLSPAADHLIDTTAISTKIDVEKFKKQQKKPIDILKVRLSTEQGLLEEGKQI